MVWGNEEQRQLTAISYPSETAQLEESLWEGTSAALAECRPSGKNGHREER
jgi:hypothetical protein